MNFSTKEIKMNNTEIHPFEKSGLGIAPFSFDSFSVDAKGTSCQHCGAFIKNVFWINSQDGNTFKVGSSCVDKADPVLYKQVKAARNAYINQLRQERKELGLKAWKAEKAEKQANNVLTFQAQYPEIYKFLESKKDENDFYFSLFNSVVNWGNLSEKQLSAVQKAMNPVVSQHLGEIGKKMEFSLTLKFKTFFEGQWGMVGIYVFEDENGNKVTYKGTGYFSFNVQDGQYSNEMFAQEGDKVVLTAKVKDHTNYKGTNQTVIERFKVKNLIRKGA